MTDAPVKRGRGRPPAQKPQAKRSRGRPRYVPTPEQRAQVERLVAAGEAHGDIGKLLGIGQPVFRSAYAEEISLGRLRLRDRLFAVTIEKALAGNAGLLKIALDLTALPEEKEQPYQLPESKPEAPAEPKAPKIGKKEQQALDAANPDTSTEMGQLMAKRAQSQGTKTVQ